MECVVGVGGYVVVGGLVGILVGGRTVGDGLVVGQPYLALVLAEEEVVQNGLVDYLFGLGPFRPPL